MSQKIKSRSCQQESIGSALETRQSHTIKHRVTKMVPKRHREGHNASAILRSPITRRRERVPMSNQRTMARVTRAGTHGKGNAPHKGCIRLLLILNSMHNSATDRRWARLHSKTPPARKPARLTTLSSSLMCEALETERRCFSNVILASKVTPNITRSADSFSTVPSIESIGLAEDELCVTWRLS